MKNFKTKFMGFIKNISDSVILGSFVSTLIFIALGLILAFMEDTVFLDVILFYLIIDLFVIFSVTLLKTNRYSGSIHRIDADLIGNNFIGLDKKSRGFRKTVENFFNGNYPKALHDFQSIEENYNLSDSEKSLLYYYIARCYDIMNYKPNALNYYEKSCSTGFSDDCVIILKARCMGAIGDIENALDIYNNILISGNNKYRQYIRTDIGRMYLDNRQPEKALKYYLDAVEKHENYDTALEGCAIAYLMLEDYEKSRDYYKYAILENPSDLEGFKAYYEEIRKAVKGSDSVV